MIDALFDIVLVLIFLFALSKLAESSFFNFLCAFDLLKKIQETEELINEKLAALYLVKGGW